MSKTKCECPPSRRLTMTVARPTFTTTVGTTATTYTNVHSGVKCDWKRRSGTEGELHGAERVRRSWEGGVSNSVDVRRLDRCTFTDKTGQHVVYVIDVVDDGEDSIVIEAKETT